MTAAKHTGPISTRKKRFLLTAMEGAFWPAMCAGYMLVVLLQEKGFSNTAIGLVLSVNAIIGIVVQPLWGMLSDWLKSIKKVFLSGITCTTLLFSSLYFIESPFAIAALIFVDIIFRCSLPSLLDTWVVTKIKEDQKLDYGVIRVAGSITYSLISYLYGMVISLYSAASMLPINFLLGLITIGFAIFTPDRASEPAPEKETLPGIGPLTALRTLLHDKKYLAVIFLVTFNSFGISSMMNFLPNFLVDAGGSPSQSAYAQGIKAMAEIPFFIFSGAILSRISSARSITLSAILNLCAVTAIFFASSPLQIMISAVFVGSAYSLMLTAKLRYILAIVPPNIAATAFTLISAFEYGLASALSNLFGGYMLDRFPVKVLNFCAICSVVAGIVIFFFMARPSNRFSKKDLSNV